MSSNKGNQLETLELIHDLYLEWGQLRYGESCSILSHSIQCFQLAIKNDKNVSPLAAACFLHDIGHFPHLQFGHPKSSKVHEYGIQDHEIIAYNFLSKLGFRDEVTMPIKLHVTAKRYLCTMNHKYYDQLSEDSKKSFQHQGGSLNTDQIAKFILHKYFDDAIELRLIDDRAKDAHFTAHNSQLDYIIPTLRAFLHD